MPISLKNIPVFPRYCIPHASWLCSRVCFRSIPLATSILVNEMCSRVLSGIEASWQRVLGNSPADESGCWQTNCLLRMVPGTCLGIAVAGIGSLCINCLFAVLVYQSTCLLVYWSTSAQEHSQACKGLLD